MSNVYVRTDTPVWRGCYRDKKCEWSVPQEGSEIPIGLAPLEKTYSQWGFEYWQMTPFTTDTRELMHRTPDTRWNRCPKGQAKCERTCSPFGCSTECKCLCPPRDNVSKCVRFGSQSTCCGGCTKCDIRHGVSGYGPPLEIKYIPRHKNGFGDWLPAIYIASMGDVTGFHQPIISNTKAIVHKHIKQIDYPKFEYEKISDSAGLNGTVQLIVEVRLLKRFVRPYISQLADHKQRWLKNGDPIHDLAVDRHRHSKRSYPAFGESLMRSNLFELPQGTISRPNDYNIFSLSILEDLKSYPTGQEYAVRKTTTRLTTITEELSTSLNSKYYTWRLQSDPVIIDGISNGQRVVSYSLKYRNLGYFGISLSGTAWRLQ